MTDVQLVGLFVVAIPLALVVIATFVAPKRRSVGLTIVASAMLLWAMALVPFVGLLAFERYDTIPVALALLVTPALAFFVMWPRRFVRRPDGASLEVRA